MEIYFYKIMRLLTSWWFAGLVITFIVAVIARPGEGESSEESEPNSNDAATDVIGEQSTESKSIRAEMRRKLAPLDRKITYYTLSAKVLTGVKRKYLDLSDAKLFIEGMSLVTVETLNGPHFKILGKILDLFDEYYEKYHDKLTGQYLQDYVQGEIRSFLFLLNRDLEHRYITPGEVAPSVTKLLESSDKEALSAAYEVAGVLMTNSEVTKELTDWFAVSPGRRSGYGCPYNFVLMAFDFMETYNH